MEPVDVLVPPQRDHNVAGAQGVIRPRGHLQPAGGAVPDGDDVDAVLGPDIQLLQGVSHPASGRCQLHDAVVIRQLDEIQDVGTGQPLSQLDPHLMFGKNHPVGSDLLQHLAVDVALSLGDDLLHSDLLEVQSDEGAVAHVVPHGHDGAVVVAHPQRLEHGGVPGVAHDGMGDLIGRRLDVFLPAVHGQHLMAQGAQLGGHRRAKTAQTDHNKRFHGADSLTDHDIKGRVFDLCGVLASGEEGDGEGQNAHPAHIHQKDQHSSGKQAQSGRDAHGEAHGPHGGGHLEGGRQEGQSVHRGQKHGAHHKQEDHHQRQGHGVHDPAVGDGPAPEGNLLPALHARPEGQQQHGHGDGLKAAGSGAAGASNEHENHRQGQGAVGQPALSEGVEAGGAQGDGLEQGIEPLLPQGHGPQGGRVAVLHGEEEQRAEQDERRGETQDQAAIEGQLFPAPVLEHILPHEKAQPTHGDECGGGQQHHRVVVEAGQAGKGSAVAAQQVKSRVAKGGDTVKDAPPQAARKTELWNEAQRQQQRPRPLHAEGAHQSVLYHPDHAVHVVQVQGGHHHQPLRQPDAPMQGQGEQGDDCHEAQSTQLDHHQDDRLSEQAPLEPGIRHDEAGDTGGRGGGE